VTSVNAVSALRVAPALSRAGDLPVPPPLESTALVPEGLRTVAAGKAVSTVGGVQPVGSGAPGMGRQPGRWGSLPRTSSSTDEGIVQPGCSVMSKMSAHSLIAPPLVLIPHDVSAF
jgi:hypothetical protein